VKGNFNFLDGYEDPKIVGPPLPSAFKALLRLTMAASSAADAEIHSKPLCSRLRTTCAMQSVARMQRLQRLLQPNDAMQTYVYVRIVRFRSYDITAFVEVWQETLL
jgi:hypothetical protein